MEEANAVPFLAVREAENTIIRTEAPFGDNAIKCC
jgi:hypothetical protein